MRNTCKSVIVSAALALMPGVVAAQDWDGLYGGLTLGYAMGDAKHSFSNLAPSDNSSPNGALLGAFVGYAIQSNNMVYGAEADIDAGNFSGSYVNATGATSGGSIDGKWQASVRGVLGSAGQLSGRPALYYATAGWATGRFGFEGGPAAGFVGNGYSDTLNGWTAGVGVDWRYTPSTSFRLEYRYSDFGTASGTLAPAFPGVTMPVAVTQHAIRFGIRKEF